MSVQYNTNVVYNVECTVYSNGGEGRARVFVAQLTHHDQKQTQNIYSLLEFIFLSPSEILISSESIELTVN